MAKLVEKAHMSSVQKAQVRGRASFDGFMSCRRVECFGRRCAHTQIDKTIQQVAYYCLQAKKEFAHPQLLPGPTGEIDELSLKGRGVVVSMCSSSDLLIRFVGQTTELYW